MKLFYFQRPDGIENFGDSLNPWLWGTLLAQELDDDETTAFVGIGTIVNGLLRSRVATARNIVIFSSGVGYGDATVPDLDDDWTIYCVRGPLSAEKLGVPLSLAVADGALLLRRVVQMSETKDCRFSFMPHVEQAMLGETVWQEVCEQAGIRYIDPRAAIEEVLSLISRTEVLLAEAMHGAIAAEALRVPWIPIRTSSRILSFKWMDWCASLNLDYQPVDILPVVDSLSILSECSLDGNHPDSVQAALNRDWLGCLNQQTAQLSNEVRQRQVQSIAEQLVRATQTVPPSLGSDDRVEALTTELETRLDQFKTDVKSGKFLDVKPRL